jgi:predicted permease
VRVLALTLPVSAPTTSSGTDLTRLSFGDIALNGESVLFGIGIGLIMAIGIGIVAAVRVTGDDHSLSLRQSGGSSATETRGVLASNGLVVAQVGLALMFLVAAGLTIQSLRRTLSIPLGYEPNGLLTLRVTLDPVRAKTDSSAMLWRSILGELRTIPGVTRVAIGSCSPLGMHCDGTTITPFGHAPRHVMYLTASSDYFAALGTPLIRGRMFNAEEMAGQRRVIVINQAAARTLWGADDPLTTPIRIDTTTIEVVGVVGDARYGDVERPAEPAVFFPHGGSRGVILLRTTGDPAMLASAARAAIRRAGAGHATSSARTMGSRLRDATARNRLSLQVFATFAMSALILAAVGVYGTLALRVSLRSRELAIRRALGASTASLAGSVAVPTARIGLAGTVLGIVGAVVVARGMSSLLYDVDASDPTIYGGAVLLLLIAMCAAAALPTMRTVRTNPCDAMNAGG